MVVAAVVAVMVVVVMVSCMCRSEDTLRSCSSGCWLLFIVACFGDRVSVRVDWLTRKP